MKCLDSLKQLGSVRGRGFTIAEHVVSIAARMNRGANNDLFAGAQNLNRWLATLARQLERTVFQFADNAKEMMRSRSRGSTSD